MVGDELLIPQRSQLFTSSEVVSGFGERFVIEICPGGDGVLVDLATGSYFRLNATAIAICCALKSTRKIDQAIFEVGHALNLPAAEAESLLLEVMGTLSAGIAPQGSADPIRYSATPDGRATFLENDRTIFSIDRPPGLLKLHASLHDLKAPLFFYVRSLMPKLLALLDVPVLHAAACRVGSSVLAFTGRSGAGKTTTARAFARAGVDLISEDMVAVALNGETSEVFIESEQFARSWAREAATQFEKAPSREVSFTELRDTPRGPTMPIGALWLIDAGRREGAEIRLRSLAIGDAIAAMLGSGFLASVEPEHWRGFVARSRQIAERTAIREATMPSGLEALSAAAQRYIVNSAS